MDTMSIFTTTQSQVSLSAEVSSCVQSEILAQANNPAPLPFQPELRVLRMKDVAEKLAIGKSILYDWLDVKSPRYDAHFPKPFKLNTKSIGWLSFEIDTWLLTKIEQTTGTITTQGPVISTSPPSPEINQQASLLQSTTLHILRIKQVADKLGIGKSTIYDWLDIDSPRYDASFPKPIKLSAKSIGWFSSKVDTWLLTKVEQARANHS